MCGTERKGLCFGSGKPLLAVGTLDTLVAQALSPAEAEANVEPQSGLYPGAEDSAGENGETQSGSYRRAEACNGEYRYIIPMIDARRMEVYAAVFKNQDNPSDVIAGSEATLQLPAYTQITETAPVIVDENIF